MYVTELWDGFVPIDMLAHRKWVYDIFSKYDDNCKDIDVSIFIKVKGFGYTLFLDYPWMLIQEMSFNNIKQRYLIEGTAVSYLSYMDLHVFDSPATTFVESIVYNAPSICLWNPNKYFVKKEYTELYNLLHSVGIICTNHEEFVLHAKKFIDNSDYWFSAEIQKVRKEFMHNLAYTSANWRTELNNTFSLVKHKQE